MIAVEPEPDISQVVVLDRRRKYGAHHRATGLMFCLAPLLEDRETNLINRHLGLVSGGQDPGLDQILESLLSLLVVQQRLDFALSGLPRSLSDIE